MPRVYSIFYVNATGRLASLLAPAFVLRGLDLKLPGGRGGRAKIKVQFATGFGSVQKH